MIIPRESASADRAIDLEQRSTRVSRVHLECIEALIFEERGLANAVGRDMSPEPIDLVAIEDCHITAIAASLVQIAASCRSYLNGGNDLDKERSHRQEYVLEAERRCMRIAIARGEVEYLNKVIPKSVQTPCDETDLPKP